MNITRREFYSISALIPEGRDPAEYVAGWRQRIIKAGLNGKEFDEWLEGDMTDEDVKNFDEINRKKWDDILAMRATIKSNLSRKN
jgi:hypothetical protein